KPAPPAGGTMVSWKWSQVGSSGPEHCAAVGTTGPPVQLTTGEACDTGPDAGEAAKLCAGRRRPKRSAVSAAGAAQRLAGWRTKDPREEETSPLIVEGSPNPKKGFANS